MFLETKQTADIKVEEVAQMLGISKSLIRFWEEEFNLPKRENGSMSRLEAAEIRLIYELIQEKSFTLEDAKAEFPLKRIAIENRFAAIALLQKIKGGLEELKERLA